MGKGEEVQESFKNEGELKCKVDRKEIESQASCRRDLRKDTEGTNTIYRREFTFRYSFEILAFIFPGTLISTSTISQQQGE